MCTFGALRLGIRCLNLLRWLSPCLAIVDDGPDVKFWEGVASSWVEILMIIFLEGFASSWVGILMIFCDHILAWSTTPHIQDNSAWCAPEVRWESLKMEVCYLRKQHLGTLLLSTGLSQWGLSLGLAIQFQLSQAPSGFRCQRFFRIYNTFPSAMFCKQKPTETRVHSTSDRKRLLMVHLDLMRYYVILWDTSR